MIIRDPGHSYKLQNTDDEGGEIYQSLFFVKKVPVTPGSDELETLEPGTTNEEVLSVLIDRMGFLQRQFPCRENAIVITKLEEAMMWLEKRTSNRKERGVEGKHLA